MPIENCSPENERLRLSLTHAVLSFHVSFFYDSCYMIYDYDSCYKDS